MTSAAGDGDWGSSTGGTDDDDENFSPQQVATSSLRDHLNSQLAELNLPLRDRQIVSALIDALDDDGYLTTSLEELLEFFPEELGHRRRRAADRAAAPAEPRARRRRRARCCRVPRRCS